MPNQPPDDPNHLRKQIAWTITVVWILCFPLAIVVPRGNLIAYAQLPMMAVVGWLFAKPLIRPNPNGETE